jgi:hypothetical protein
VALILLAKWWKVHVLPMNTADKDLEVPLTGAALSAPEGYVAGGSAGSKNVELNAQLARQNAKLAQEIAELVQERDLLRTVIDNLPDKI